MLECQYCGDEFGSRGLYAHEVWCDQNPDRGEPSSGERPDERRDSPSDQTEEARHLPESTTLGVTDESNDESNDECPECGGNNVMEADTAKARLREKTKELPERVAAALSLSDHYCANPDCAAIWSDRDDSVTMDEVLAA